MNCFCGLVDRRDGTIEDSYHRKSPTLAGFEAAQNLSSDFIESKLRKRCISP